jgi:hypothetical protein
MVEVTDVGDVVYWRVKHRDLHMVRPGYVTITARVLSPGKRVALVEVIDQDDCSRGDLIVGRLHLQPLVRLYATRAEAEAVTWEDDKNSCPRCGGDCLDPASGENCRVSLVNLRR